MTLLKEKITFGTIMGVVREYFVMTIGILLYTCLLYTSDAADEL